jgi:hypothetical protein
MLSARFSTQVEASLVVEFLKRSAGRWRSERRYYALPAAEAQEMVSEIEIRHLERGSPELAELARLHGVEADEVTCGSQVSWQTSSIATGREESTGSTCFGVYGNQLLRDGGFAVKGAVRADYYFTDENTLCLRTAYNGSVFEEELKLVGKHYRTRQTIISRAGEQKLIGQYLEKRLSDAADA